MIELDYVEMDGLLYPDIDTGFERLGGLDKYGKWRLKYLYTKRPELYRELLFTGKLAEHCAQVEARAFKLSEQIQDAYIAKNPLPEDDFWMRVSIRMMAQMVTNAIESLNTEWIALVIVQCGISSSENSILSFEP